MEDQYINLVITIISGVLVYVISQWYTEFILRPIQEYKQLKAKVAKLLVLHAPYYSNPQFLEKEGDHTAWATASSDIREVAAEVAAFAEIKPNQFLVFAAIPRRRRLLEAQQCLIGLSNSFFTTANSEDRCIDRICEYPDIIKRNLGITYTKKKRKK